MNILLKHNKQIFCTDDFSLVENFSQENKTRIIKVEVWSFDRSSAGKAYVTWANGAIATFCTTFKKLMVLIIERLKYQRYKKYSEPLPENTDLLFSIEKDIPVVAVEREEQHDAIRVKHHRPDLRQKTLRRVRPG